MFKLNTLTTRTKIYSRRDSITKLLKEAGFTREQYDDFIEVSDNGQFIFHIDKAQEFLAVREMKNKPKGSKIVRHKAGEKPKGLENISQSIIALIKKGMDNKSIIAALNLDKGRRHYPGWYRAKLNRESQQA